MYHLVAVLGTGESGSEQDLDAPVVGSIPGSFLHHSAWKQMLVIVANDVELPARIQRQPNSWEQRVRRSSWPP